MPDNKDPQIKVFSNALFVERLDRMERRIGFLSKEIGEIYREMIQLISLHTHKYDRSSDE